jgi:acyl-coenzyme A thioesterase PaaI-like protein
MSARPEAEPADERPLMPLIDYSDPAPPGPAEILGDSVRAFLDAVVSTTVDDEDLRAVTTAVDALTARLSGPNGSLLRDGMPWPSYERMRRGDRPHNPVLGRANPIAPPLPITVCDDGSVMSELTMRPIYEGPGGFVHGGWVASLLDQLLGSANIVSGHPAMTGTLTIRYRRGTPHGVPLTLRGRTDRVEGRRVHASGEIIADGEITAEAEGLFILPSPEKVAEIRRVARTRTIES